MKKFKELLFFKHLAGFTNIKLNKEIIPVLDHLRGIEACVLFLQDKNFSFTEEEILSSWDKTEKVYSNILSQKDITVITIFDDTYPKRLHDLKNKKPPILYAKGNIDLLEKESIGVVGTRSPSTWSISVEKNLLAALFKASDPVIVSGLALGCDSIAHETTLLHDRKTIAVLPSGVNRITPKANEALAEKILKKGGLLVSEYAPYENARKQTYIQRDSIIAALSDKLIVIECKKNSGTMHTVTAAKKLGRFIGCYQPTNDYSSYENFSGNRLLAYYKEILKLQNKEHLIEFINQKAKSKPEEDYIQCHLEL